MWIPTAAGVAVASGVFGAEAAALAVPVTGVMAFLMPALVSLVMTREAVAREYFARAPVAPRSLGVIATCPIEGTRQHRSDFVLCPYYENKFISSTACASERNCKTMCHAAA
jgi:hypothetical protein